MAADHHDDGPGILLANAVEHFQAIHTRHLHVEEGHIRFELRIKRERFPAAEAIAAEPLVEWLTTAEIPPTSYIVVLTRGHRQDFDVLRALADRPYRYVGLIGSRAKVARLTAALLDAGVSADWLRTLRAPIGFDIGAVSPEEIAVAIVAELIAVRRGRINDPQAAAVSMQWSAPRVR